MRGKGCQTVMRRVQCRVTANVVLTSRQRLSSVPNILPLNVIYGVIAHDLATDHAKSTQAPGAGMLNYPTHKLNFHSLPATTQPWAA